MKYVKIARQLDGKDMHISLDTVADQFLVLPEEPSFGSIISNLIHGGKLIIDDLGESFSTNNTQPAWTYKFQTKPCYNAFYATKHITKTVGNQKKVTFYKDCLSSDKKWLVLKPGQQLPLNALKTVQECYTVNQELIKKVMDARNYTRDISDDPRAQQEQRIYFQKYHEVSVELGTWLNHHNIGYTCNDQKVYMEIRAQEQVDKELDGLRVPKISERQFTDDELAFYGKAFGIQVPEYYVKRLNVHTTQGFAVLPSFETTPDKFMFHRKGEPGYAGNEENISVPYTLSKDATAVKVQLHARERLQEQVEYYLDLPESLQAEFLTDSYVLNPETHQIEEAPRMTRDEEEEIAKRYQKSVANPAFADPAAIYLAKQKRALFDNMLEKLPQEHRDYLFQHYGFEKYTQAGKKEEKMAVSTKEVNNSQYLDMILDELRDLLDI